MCVLLPPWHPDLIPVARSGAELEVWKTLRVIPGKEQHQFQLGLSSPSIPSLGMDPLRMPLCSQGWIPKVLSQGAAGPEGCKAPDGSTDLWHEAAATLELQDSRKGGGGSWKGDMSESWHYRQLSHESRSSGRFWDVPQGQHSMLGQEHSHQHHRTLLCCCWQGRTFPILQKTPAGSRSSTQAGDLPSTADPWMWLSSAGSGERHKHNFSLLQPFPAWPWVFPSKSAAIHISSFWRHGASPW